MGCAAWRSSPYSNIAVTPVITSNQKKPPSPMNKITSFRRKALNIKRVTFAFGEVYNEKKPLKCLKDNNNTLQDQDLIDKVFMKHFFLRNLKSQYRIELIKKLCLYQIESDTILFKEGGQGKLFFIIKEGEIDLSMQGEFKKKFIEWDSFGELALLHNSPRSGQALVKKKSLLWCLERKVFYHTLTHLNDLYFEENKKFFDSLPLFKSMNHTLKPLLCLYLIKETHDKGKKILSEGEVPMCMYFIKEGTVSCIKEGKEIKQLTAGDLFGEKSILTAEKRTCDVIALSQIVIYSISIESLKYIMGSEYKLTLYSSFIKAAFDHADIIIKEEIIQKMFPCFKIMNYSKNDIVFNQDYEKNSQIAIIIEGVLKNKSTGEPLYLKKGEILFGDCVIHATNISQKMQYDIISDPDSLLLIAKISDLEKVLQVSFTSFLETRRLVTSLYNVSLFKTLPSNKIEEIASKIVIESFPKGAVIINENEEGPKFYIIKQGKIAIYVKGKYQRTINQFEYFGEKSLVVNEKRSASAISMNELTILYTLNKEDFTQIVCEENLMQYLTANIAYQDDSVQLDNLQWLKTLGQGSYGTVYLVRKKDNNELYALKTIPKIIIQREKMIPNIEMEKKILLKINHPFILKMVKILKDNLRIYFLLEYIYGKSLYDVIRDIGLLNNEESKFYGGSILIAVDFLHRRSIIHRDIKPDNIMVQSNGYIKLIDFGTAKEIKDKTTTIIGTPEYMAPEVILGEGYSYTSDYWSVAICLYEFICGQTPIGNNETEPIEIYKEIVSFHELKFPSFPITQDFKGLMKSMLNSDPLKRICSFKQIKKHLYFNSFDWKALENLNYKIPTFPQLTKEDYKIDELKVLDFIQFINKEDRPTSVNPISEAKNKKFNDWFNSFS